MRRLRPLLLPTIAGVLYFLSWIGFGIWPLAFVCFLPHLWALRGTTPMAGRSNLLGFLLCLLLRGQMVLALHTSHLTSSIPEPSTPKTPLSTMT